MRKLFTIVSILTIAISCSSNQHLSASAVGLVNLQNYVAKSNLDLPYDFNYMVVTNQEAFDETFGIAKPGNINITYPSFTGQTVVACVAQPTANNVAIRFEKAEVTGKELNVYCSTTQLGAQLNKTVSPIAIATVPKVISVKRVNFYANGEKAITRLVDFKNESPKTAKESTPCETKPVVLKRVMRRPAII